MDGSLLLPYSQISINTIEFSKRLPYNTIEKARRVSDVYMSIYIYTVLIKAVLHCLFQVCV